MIRNFTLSFLKTFAAFVCTLFLYSSVLAQLPTAQTIANQMTVGWNIGNTYEVPNGQNWANVALNQQVINAIKAAGFNTVRIPCAWDSYANPSTLVIDPNHFASIKQAVDLCINNNMYVIINIHWDGGWLEKHITLADKDAVNVKQNSYWTQIANYFKNYDEHLLFASANEPDASDATGVSVLLSYHQTFVNAVRATGGNNSTRTLIVQGPQTNIELTSSLMTSLPTDPTANRMMVEIHYYTPYQFCILGQDGPNSWEKMYYYWGSQNHSTLEPNRNSAYGEESAVDQSIGLMKTNFIDKGIPVIMGEFGAYRKNVSPAPLEPAKHAASVNYFYNYVVKKAKSSGLIPIVWETGGLYNRTDGTCKDQPILDNIMQGSGAVTTTVTFQNKVSNLYIDGLWKNTNGASAGQWSSASGSQAQQWVQEVYGNYFKFKNVGTGLYLDGLGKTTNGSDAGQWSNSTSNNQQWSKETSGNYVRLKNRATGLYLDGMWSSTNGSSLGQWSLGSDAQLWGMSTLGIGLKSATISTVKQKNANSDVDVTLYPNPFTSSINLGISKQDELERITISDLSGKVVETITTPAVKNVQTIGASLLPNIYIVQVYGKDWVKTFKIVKE